MDRQEFLRLYDKLRPEPVERLDEIANYVFSAFDKGKKSVIIIFKINTIREGFDF